MQVSFALALALALSQSSPAKIPDSPDVHRLPIPEMVGSIRYHTVKAGESLYSIARKNGVGTLELAHANELKSQTAKRGTNLRLPTLHIPPMTPKDGIVLNIPERAVYVFRDGELVKRYPGAVGKAVSQTALGSFTLRSRVVNPTWRPPRSMVVNEGVRDAPVPPGPGNPLGDRWMGWSKPGFGFHSTTSPRSIGRAASHGCVRLYPEGARSMFGVVKVGMPIHAIYKPIVLGKREGAYYLSVFPDIYRRGGSSLKDAREILEAAGLASLVDEKRLKRIVARLHSSPQRILGEDETIYVDGAPVTTAVRPVLAGGVWLVALNEVAAALGMTVEQPAAESVRIAFQGTTFEGRIGESRGVLDAEEKTLPHRIELLEGKILVPLRLIMDVAGVSATVERGKAIRIGSQTLERSR